MATAHRAGRLTSDATRANRPDICSSTHADIGDWDVSAVTEMGWTFDGAAVFNDIKEGSSKCPNAKMCGAMVGCCKHGFRAGKGWDPLTGLGSVDFQRLRDELVRLP